MAPELALQALEQVKPGGVIVDPMMGSGTVIRQASDFGLQAIGFDLDPLAVLMSRVWTTPVQDERVEVLYAKALKLALAADPYDFELPWIDDDEETREFVGYWFGKSQRADLRCWSFALHELSQGASREDAAALDVIRIALSRIIITKEQCASLARDTSHSRPHRVTLQSSYCVNQGLERSLNAIRKRLSAAPPSGGAVVSLGDARALSLESHVADAVLTSPPYLNAIDYMRGHRLALVWLGHRLDELRAIRSFSIGAERGAELGRSDHQQVRAALGDLSALPSRHIAMINRYVSDITALAAEIYRVLKPGGTTTLVVGNSCLKGVFIENSAAVSKALQLQGMKFIDQKIRPLPAQSRYLPTQEGSSLAKRMREETIIKWAA